MNSEIADLRDMLEAMRDKWQRSVDRDPDGKLSVYDRVHVATLNDVLSLIDDRYAGGVAPVTGRTSNAGDNEALWGAAATLKVGGKPFICRCGANVLLKSITGDLFRCNGCLTVYQG